MLRLAGKSAHRSGRVSSNVRPHEEPTVSHPSAPGQVLQRGSGWFLLAFLPLASWVLLAVVFVTRPAVLARITDTSEAEIATWAVSYWLASLAYTAVFIVHALRNRRLQPAARLPWIVGFAFAAPVAAPVYWWKGLTAPE